jgi:hypothetical protein
LIPTSITKAPGLTISAVTNRGRPIAATRMSAFPGQRRQIAGTRVADHHRRVLFEQQERDREADDVRATQHQRPRAFETRAGAGEQLHHPFGSAGHEPRLAPLHPEPADVDRMKAVDIFLDRNRCQDFFIVDRGRQR